MKILLRKNPLNPDFQRKRLLTAIAKRQGYGFVRESDKHGGLLLRKVKY